MDAKKGKRGKIALAVMLTLAIAVVGTAGFLILNLLAKINPSAGNIPADSGGDLVTEKEESLHFGTVHDITDATNLKSFLYQWWYNGGDDMIRYSRNVVNILLVGVDNNDGQVGAGRSDVIMLASVNKKTGEITLLSVLRDSYCYFNVNGKEYYHRINSAYYYGGPAGLMETLTRLYKIRVDKYITVDFGSFPKLIDALGGVTVDVTEAEARYINRTAPSQKGNFPVGEGVQLTGQQALIYSRIRKLDSDMARTNRQQKVIESILTSARGASIGQLYNAIEITLPYVQTNYSRSELLTMIPSAMGWLDYDVIHMSSPVVEGEVSDRESTAISGKINGMDIWIVDYPKAAREVQLALYGESNIDLQEDAHRNEYIDSLFNGSKKDNSSGGSSGGTQQTTQSDQTGDEDYDPDEPVTEPGEEGVTSWLDWWNSLTRPNQNSEEATTKKEATAAPTQPPTESAAIFPFG